MSGITDPTEEYFKDGIWGWDGTQWRKAGLPLWYADRLAGDVINFNADAGVNNLEGDATPAGELWIVQRVAGVNSTSGVARLLIRALSSTHSIALTDAYDVVAGHWVTVATELLMKQSDHLSCHFNGCTAGDDLYLCWWGYKVKVT